MAHFTTTHHVYNFKQKWSCIIFSNVVTNPSHMHYLYKVPSNPNPPYNFSWNRPKIYIKCFYNKSIYYEVWLIFILQFKQYLSAKFDIKIIY
jgi:hypothetical protein